MINSLATEQCADTFPDTPPATPADITDLHRQTSDWQIIPGDDDIPRLWKTFRFRDFNGAIQFSVRLGSISRRRDAPPAPACGMGPRRRGMVDAQNRRAPPQRLHNGIQNRRPLRPNLSRITHPNPHQSPYPPSLRALYSQRFLHMPNFGLTVKHGADSKRIELQCETPKRPSLRRPRRIQLGMLRRPAPRPRPSRLPARTNRPRRPPHNRRHAALGHLLPP